MSYLDSEAGLIHYYEHRLERLKQKKVQDRKDYDRQYYAKRREEKKKRNLENYYTRREHYLAAKAVYREKNREVINLSSKLGLPMDMTRNILKEQMDANLQLG